MPIQKVTTRLFDHYEDDRRGSRVAAGEFWSILPGVTHPADFYDIRPATPADVPLILTLIRELAEFERLLHEVTGDEASLHEHLFGPRPAAEVLLAFAHGDADGAGAEAAGMALFFQNFSTFLTRPGIYLEDLYVRPAHRKQGLGKALLRRLAQLAVKRRCGRFEWAVLDWNENAIGFYQKLGARLLDDWRICRVTGDALKSLANLDAE